MGCSGSSQPQKHDFGRPSPSPESPEAKAARQERERQMEDERDSALREYYNAQDAQRRLAEARRARQEYQRAFLYGRRPAGELSPEQRLCGCGRGRRVFF